MFNLVFLYLLLWSPPHAVFANEKCARFDIPNVRNNTLTLQENIEASFFFNITNYSCIKHGNFRLKVARVNGNNHPEMECVLLHRNSICHNSASRGSCVCTENRGTYRFTRTVDRSDSVRWIFWVNSSLVNGAEIEEDVGESNVVFSVVSSHTPASTAASPTKLTRQATGTPPEGGENGRENGGGNIRMKAASHGYTDTDSITPLTALHGDDDNANLMFIYIIIGVVGSIIVVVAIISSVICGIKAYRAKHPNPLSSDYELSQPVTQVLGDGRQLHQKVTRLRPMGHATTTQQQAEGPVFQNQLYQNPHEFLVQQTQNDDDDYLVTVVR